MEVVALTLEMIHIVFYIFCGHVACGTLKTLKNEFIKLLVTGFFLKCSFSSFYIKRNMIFFPLYIINAFLYTLIPNTELRFKTNTDSNFLKMFHLLLRIFSFNFEIS